MTKNKNNDNATGTQKGDVYGMTHCKDNKTCKT